MRGALDKVINVFIEEHLSPQAQKALVIKEARKILARLKARYPGVPYKTSINGTQVSNGTEESMSANGSITYEFMFLKKVAREALVLAKDESPVESGRYKRSWFILYEGAEINVSELPDAAVEIILTNDQPYARKIQTRGARLARVQPGIVDRIKVKLASRYKSFVNFEVKYIELHGAYVLKHDYIQTRKNGRRRLRERRGSELMYPALLMELKAF